MPCYRPLKAIRREDGTVQVRKRDALDDLGGPSSWFELPCGQCQDCRLERSRQWSTRIMHEASLHDDNSFITLTYRDMPDDSSLNHEHWQNFAKKVRNRVGKLRFYMCGEYGDKNQRPHYHACIFGHAFKRDEWEPLEQNHQGDVLYESPLLSDLWEHGFASIGELTDQSASYVARYVMKRSTGDIGLHEYNEIDTETGEVLSERRPPYSTMSLKPGIGANWLKEYTEDVYPHDQVVLNGRRSKPPRYYDTLMSRRDPALVEDLKSKRIREAEQHAKDLTPQRLAERERIASRRRKRLKRNL